MFRIQESGMIFGEFDDKNVFYLEKSSQYVSKLKGKNVKTCEFLLHRDNSIYFIEAKTSCPNATNATTSEESLQKYNEFINDIINKMRHSLTIFSNVLLNRISNEGIPEVFLNNDLKDKKLKLILVIKTALNEWLIPIEEKLNKEFISDLHIWGINKIFVINEETARNNNFII